MDDLGSVSGSYPGGIRRLCHSYFYHMFLYLSFASATIQLYHIYSVPHFILPHMYFCHRFLSIWNGKFLVFSCSSGLLPSRERWKSPLLEAQEKMAPHGLLPEQNSSRIITVQDGGGERHGKHNNRTRLSAGRHWGGRWNRLA